MRNSQNAIFVQQFFSKMYHIFANICNNIVTLLVMNDRNKTISSILLCMYNSISNQFMVQIDQCLIMVRRKIDGKRSTASSESVATVIKNPDGIFVHMDSRDSMSTTTVMPSSQFTHKPLKGLLKERHSPIAGNRTNMVYYVSILYIFYAVFLIS